MPPAIPLTELVERIDRAIDELCEIRRHLDPWPRPLFCTERGIDDDQVPWLVSILSEAGLSPHHDTTRNVIEWTGGRPVDGADGTLYTLHIDTDSSWVVWSDGTLVMLDPDHPSEP